jgi:SAM-dependent methyltransferase
MTNDPAATARPTVTSPAPIPYLDLVIGIDQDPAMVATARARIAVHPNVEVRHADAHHLPLEAASIDRARADRNQAIGRQPPRLTAQAGFTVRAVRNTAAVLTDFDTAETILGLRRNTERAVTAGYLTPEAGGAWPDHLTGSEAFFATSSMITVLAVA